MKIGLGSSGWAQRTLTVPDFLQVFLHPCWSIRGISSLVSVPPRWGAPGCLNFHFFESLLLASKPYAQPENVWPCFISFPVKAFHQAPKCAILESLLSILAPLRIGLDCLSSQKEHTTPKERAPSRSPPFTQHTCPRRRHSGGLENRRSRRKRNF